jgi:hypothetical protein
MNMTDYFIVRKDMGINEHDKRLYSEKGYGRK